MRQILKRIVNGMLQPVGLEVRRTQDRLANDPFWVQSQLVKNERPVIFDVGAHDGEVSALYRQTFPASTLHLFEPYPPSFQILEARFKGDPLVRANAVAVSDAEGTIEMNLNEASVTNSILKTAPQGAAVWGDHLLTTRAVAQVPTTTIDAYCRAHAIEAIDILKLDIQGAELKALHGARAILEKGRVGLVYMELILAPTYDGQPAFEDYLHFFDEVGYTLLDLYSPFRKNFYLVQSDIIWVPGRKDRMFS